MTRVLALYARLIGGFSVFIGQACSVLLFTCIAVSAWEVVMRYGFDRPTVWTIELAMALCAGAWVLSVGYVTQRNRHISITMLELLVSPRVWRLFRLLQMLISIAAVFVLLLALWDPAVKALARVEHSGTAMNSIQPTFLKVLLPVGCALYLLQLVANVIHWFQHTEAEVDGGH